MIPAFRYGYNQADRAMQFLVYLTVLMASVSTILLEVTLADITGTARQTRHSGKRVPANSENRGAQRRA
jgi:hypothetical protein